MSQTRRYPSRIDFARVRSRPCPSAAKAGPAARPRRHKFRTDTKGVAALEFALVSPIILLMLLGMVCFGLYFVYMHELQELSSSAARASVAGLNEAERDSLAKQYVADAVTNSTLLNSPDLVVSTSTSGTPATYYAVTLSYNLKDTPIPVLSKFVSLQLPNISRTATIQFGNY
jgi:Flp pilus assembly protein TadG